MQQLEIPLLFVTPKSEDDPVDSCLDWFKTHGCAHCVEPYIARLFNEFGRSEAWSRSAIFSELCGPRQVDGWCLDDAELLGVYDHSVDYHVIWDRHWALQMLVPREFVPKVWKCGYGGLPKFWDKEGNLLYQSVYMHDGKILTREERKAALAGDSL